MRLSLLNMRSRLKPLVWLVLLTMLPVFSPHLVEGVVLCIGESHVAVESVAANHHDGLDAQSNSQAQPDTDLGSFVRALRDEQGSAVSDSSCLDLPLRITQGADRCHQAVQSEKQRGGGEAPALPAERYETVPRAKRTVASSLETASRGASPSPRSTVVLLI